MPLYKFSIDKHGDVKLSNINVNMFLFVDKQCNRNSIIYLHNTGCNIKILLYQFSDDTEEFMIGYLPTIEKKSKHVTMLSDFGILKYAINTQQKNYMFDDIIITNEPNMDDIVNKLNKILIHTGLFSIIVEMNVKTPASPIARITKDDNQHISDLIMNWMTYHFDDKKLKLNCIYCEINQPDLHAYPLPMFLNKVQFNSVNMTYNKSLIPQTIEYIKNLFYIPTNIYELD